MEYWEKMENVTEEAAALQVKIYAAFPGSKRMEIATIFFNFGVLGTRDWIKEQNPSFSELEVTLEFVRMSYEAGEMAVGAFSVDHAGEDPAGFAARLPRGGGLGGFEL